MEPTINSKPEFLTKKQTRSYNFEPEDLTCRCCERVRGNSKFSAKALVRLYKLTTIQSDIEKAAFIRNYYKQLKCNDCMVKKHPNMQCYSCKKVWGLVNFAAEQIHKGDKALCKGCAIYIQKKAKSQKGKSLEYELPGLRDSSLPIQSRNDITNQGLFTVNNNEPNCKQQEAIDLTINRKNGQLKNDVCTICESKCSIHLCCCDCKNTMILVKFPRDQRGKGDKARCNTCTKNLQDNKLFKLNTPDIIDLESSNNICPICESICTKHLRCSACMTTMRLIRFNESQRSKGDEACCRRCVKREKKKMLQIANANSSVLSVDNSSCYICKSKCSTHIKCCACLETKSVERYSANQKDKGNNAICCDCEDNIQEISEAYSKSEINNIISPSDSANPFEISDQIQDTEISNLALDNKDNSLFINIAQDNIQFKDKEQSYLNTCEPISIQNFDKNIYSLSQLIGRKNPPISSYTYTPFEIPEEYESEKHDEIDMKENSTPFENLLLFDNDSGYNQHNSQKATNDPSDIKEYVRQFVDSIYNQSLDQ